MPSRSRSFPWNQSLQLRGSCLGVSSLEGEPVAGQLSLQDHGHGRWSPRTSAYSPSPSSWASGIQKLQFALISDPGQKVDRLAQNGLAQSTERSGISQRQIYREANTTPSSGVPQGPRLALRWSGGVGDLVEHYSFSVIRHDCSFLPLGLLWISCAFGSSDSGSPHVSERWSHQTWDW